MVKARGPLWAAGLVLLLVAAGGATLASAESLSDAMIQRLIAEGRIEDPREDPSTPEGETTAGWWRRMLREVCNDEPWRYYDDDTGECKGSIP